MKVLLVNSIYAPRSNDTAKMILLRGGTVQELPDDFARDAIKSGVAKEVEQDVEPGATAEQVAGPTELPTRPGNGATKQEWFDYLDDLEDATPELGDLVVPDDAKRDDLIAIGDQRVAAWNARQGV